MAICIAFFRGINVGGNNSLPMQELTKELEQLGLGEVRTYIQSGNAVFRCSPKRIAHLEKKISQAVEQRHGFAPRVIIVRVQDLEHAIAVNPWPEATRDPKSLHIFFLAEAPTEPDLAGLEQLRAPSERYKLEGKLFYLHTPEGLARSRLATRVEKCLGVEMTGRNWRTVAKVLELAWDLA